MLPITQVLAFLDFSGGHRASFPFSLGQQILRADHPLQGKEG